MALTTIGKWDIAGFSYCPNIAFYGIPHNMISLIELRGSSIVFTGHCSISRAQDPVYHIMKTIPILSRKKKKKSQLLPVRRYKPTVSEDCIVLKRPVHDCPEPVWLANKILRDLAIVLWSCI